MKRLDTCYRDLKIIRLRLRGYRPKEIARELGATTAMVYKSFQRIGWQVPKDFDEFLQRFNRN